MESARATDVFSQRRRTCFLGRMERPRRESCRGRRGCAAQALENARSKDLLFWASRYNLFVLWSADRTHPWDALPGAASHTTLEIGKLRGSDREVCVPVTLDLHALHLLPSSHCVQRQSKMFKSGHGTDLAKRGKAARECSTGCAPAAASCTALCSLPCRLQGVGRLGVRQRLSHAGGGAAERQARDRLHLPGGRVQDHVRAPARLSF